MPTLSIERQEIAAQPVLFVRSTVARSELATAIGSSIGRSYAQAQKAGVAVGGRPFTRYTEMNAQRLTIECGMPTATPAPGEGDVEAGTLSGGPVVVAMHAGHYDQLKDTFAAVERWIEAEGLRKGGAPWESYVTDPADHPDPATWRTLVYWPIAN
jgi:effector-binding domain-containing protein